VRYRIALRSPVAVDHLELVQGGKVVKAFKLTGDRRSFDAAGMLDVDTDGWVLLRAWNEHSDPLILDLYPYATTSPVWLDVPGGLPPDPADAAYFAAWLDRTIADAETRTDFRTAGEKESVLRYLREARDHFRLLAAN
jgi:hypothetical protein